MKSCVELESILLNQEFAEIQFWYVGVDGTIIELSEDSCFYQFEFDDNSFKLKLRSKDGKFLLTYEVGNSCLIEQKRDIDDSNILYFTITSTQGVLGVNILCF